MRLLVGGIVIMSMIIEEIDVHNLSELHQESAENVRIIDVREVNEVAMGAIPGAEHIPLATLPFRLQDLHPEHTLVMVCRSGARSAQACYFLLQNGFKNVVNLRGGMMAWHGAGLPAGLPQTA
jgi:rhodanese-related sulfurtransferase